MELAGAWSPVYVIGLGLKGSDPSRVADCWDRRCIADYRTIDALEYYRSSDDVIRPLLFVWQAKLSGLRAVRILSVVQGIVYFVCIIGQ